MKTCSICHTSKDESEYFKINRSYLLSFCKRCFVIKYRPYKTAYRKEVRQKMTNDDIIKLRNYNRNYSRKYFKNRIVTDDIINKLKCRQRTSYLIRKGVLKRLPCEMCNDINSEAHHQDYNEPEQIKWLCRKCHLQLHNKLKKA